MSTENREIIFSVGRRLREERERLGFKSQEALGNRLSKSKKTITNWELDATVPDVNDLTVMNEIGFDVYYIILGGRLPFGVAQSRPLYSPAERAAVEVQKLVLSEEDSQLLLAFARRLAGNGKKTQ